MKKKIYAIITSMTVACILSSCGGQATDTNKSETVTQSVTENTSVSTEDNVSTQNERNRTGSITEAAKYIGISANTAFVEMFDDGAVLPDDFVIISSDDSKNYNVPDNFNVTEFKNRMNNYALACVDYDWFLTTNSSGVAGYTVAAEKSDHKRISTYKGSPQLEYNIKSLNEENINGKSFEELYDLCTEELSELSVTKVPDVEMKEQELYSGNDVKIIAKSMNIDDDGCHVKIYIENNSDLNLTIYARAYGVNGIMTGNNIYDLNAGVAPQSKANATLDIDKEIIEFMNTSAIKDIDILFWAYNKDSIQKVFDTGQLEIKTNIYDDTRIEIGEEVLYDNNGLKVSYFGNNGSNYFYVVTNDTSEYLKFDVEEININGFTWSGYNFDLNDVITLKGCQSLIAIDVNDNNFLKANDISKVEQIDFKLSVRPNEDYHSEYKTDKISHSCD